MSEHQQIQQSKKPDSISQKQATPVNQSPVSNPASIIQRARINPKSLTSADVLQLQRTIGNRAVGRLLSEIRRPSTVQQVPIQRQEIPEEEEPLQGKMADPVQRQEIPEEEEPLQGKMIGTVQRQEIPEEEEPLQKKSENNTGMTDNLKAGVESLSGIDMSDVRVHYNSDKPAEVGALAYTQGTNIHVAPGQEMHLPHEAWHVVQQVQGRVRPTLQTKKGISINNNAELEYEADVIGNKAQRIIKSESIGTTSIRCSKELHELGNQLLPIQRQINYPVVPQAENDPRVRINVMIDQYNQSLGAERTRNGGNRHHNMHLGKYHEIRTAIELVWAGKITHGRQISRDLTSQEAQQGLNGDSQRILTPTGHIGPGGVPRQRELDMVYTDPTNHRLTIVEAKDTQQADISQVQLNKALATQHNGDVLYSLKGDRHQAALSTEFTRTPQTPANLNFLILETDKFVENYQNGLVTTLDHIPTMEELMSLPDDFNPEYDTLEEGLETQ